MRNQLQNLGLLTGFAYKDPATGQWLLQQRAPIAMAIPFTVAPGVREPEFKELIDLVTQVHGDGSTARFVATHVARAAKTSIPRKLEWSLPGVSAFGQNGVGAVARNSKLMPDIAESLIETPDLPPDVMALADRDPTLGQWVQGVSKGAKLLNHIMLTGFLGEIRRVAATERRKAYWRLALHTSPTEVVPMRLNEDMRDFLRVRRLLSGYTGMPLTFIGEARAKVTPNDDGSVQHVEHYIRLKEVALATPDDMEALPDWVESWSAAGKARNTTTAA